MARPYTHTSNIGTYIYAWTRPNSAQVAASSALTFCTIQRTAILRGGGWKAGQFCHVESLGWLDTDMMHGHQAPSLRICRYPSFPLSLSISQYLSYVYLVYRGRVNYTEVACSLSILARRGLGNYAEGVYSLSILARRGRGNYTEGACSLPILARRGRGNYTVGAWALPILARRGRGNFTECSCSLSILPRRGRGNYT